MSQIRLNCESDKSLKREWSIIMTLILDSLFSA